MTVTQRILAATGRAGLALAGAAAAVALGAVRSLLLAGIDAVANAVLPGWIATEMTERLQNWDAFNEKAIGRVPMCRWGEGEDFAGIAVYFASDASKFHTGDSVVIDGGYSIF